MSNNLYSATLEDIKSKKQRILDGKLNCIPFDLGGFEQDLPGIEQEQLILITANSKVGKCFAKGTKVILLDGTTKNVEDITESDVLLGPDSTPRHVAGITTGEEEMFRIYSDFNSTVMTVNKSHILYLWDVENLKYLTITVAEYLKCSNTIKSTYRLVKVPNILKTFNMSTYRTIEGFGIEPIGMGTYYGFTVDKNHLFLLDNFTIVHNTQITDYLYLYTPLLYSLENPDKVKIKIFYFTLEVSKKKKMTQFMCFLLFRLSRGEIHIDMKSISSIFADKPVDDEIIQFLESPEYLKYADHIEKCVEFIDNKKNPTGIYKTIKEYMEKPEVGYYGPSTTMKWQAENGTYYDKEVKGAYTKTDSEEYVIAIIDHLALMQPEKGQKDVRDAMIYFSSHYALDLRDTYKCTVVMVQQQAAALVITTWVA